MVPTEVGILEPLQIRRSGRAVPPGPSIRPGQLRVHPAGGRTPEELRLVGGKTSHRPPPVQAAGNQSKLLPARPEYRICGLSGLLSENASPRIASRTHIKSRSLVK